MPVNHDAAAKRLASLLRDACLCAAVSLDTDGHDSEDEEQRKKAAPGMAAYEEIKHVGKGGYLAVAERLLAYGVRLPETEKGRVGGKKSEAEEDRAQGRGGGDGLLFGGAADWAGRGDEGADEGEGAT
jgi:hypothetical protein